MEPDVESLPPSSRSENVPSPPEGSWIVRGLGEIGAAFRGTAGDWLLGVFWVRCKQHQRQGPRLARVAMLPCQCRFGHVLASCGMSVSGEEKEVIPGGRADVADLYPVAVGLGFSSIRSTRSPSQFASDLLVVTSHLDSTPFPSPTDLRPTAIDIVWNTSIQYCPL